MEFTSADKLVVTELLKGEKVDLFALHSRYRLSPAQLVNSTVKLSKIGAIRSGDYEDGFIELTDRGLEILLLWRNSIYCREEQWKSVPEEMKRPMMEIDSQYVPNYRKLGSFMRKKQRSIYREMKVRRRVD